MEIVRAAERDLAPGGDGERVEEDSEGTWTYGY